MVEATQRFVPGAPPPAPVSKSQKKRKTKVKTTEETSEPHVVIPDAQSAALVEEAPEKADIQEGSVSVELVAQSESGIGEGGAKTSPIVELVSKRLKATSKKITRISTYASTDPEKLNDDQKRSLKGLPALEAVQKELAEVKKAIEIREAEHAQETAEERAEAERANAARVAEAVAATERELSIKMSKLLQFLRLRTVLATGDLGPVGLNLDRTEVNTVFAAADVLLGEEGDAKHDVVAGFLSGEGDFQGISYAHLLEIASQILEPTQETETEQDETETAKDVSGGIASPIEAVEGAPVVGLPNSMTTSGSFHFMQASELESPSDKTGWVEINNTEQPEIQAAPEPTIPEPISVEAANGHLQPDSVGGIPVPTSAPIDWAADDEDGLPSLPSLHAKFGTSGTATPVGESVEQEQPAPNGYVNGDASEAPPASMVSQEDDGFTEARGGRGRGRGFRGGARGGFRGGDRGGFRGGDRGFRGGPRGDRGRGRGDWRGGDGERGRGGRGRGRGARGGPAPTAA